MEPFSEVVAVPAPVWLVEDREPLSASMINDLGVRARGETRRLCCGYLADEVREQHPAERLKVWRAFGRANVEVLRRNGECREVERGW